VRSREQTGALTACLARLYPLAEAQKAAREAAAARGAAPQWRCNTLRARAAIRRRGARQGGSAMLIVFLFAAVIAIMLYRELPVTLFEAQRQKEQLLVDRGHEYTRAVQLYYRRFRGQYPASIDQLENTNNMRFLRHRFKDPFTGKDDWRLLHAGPGGMLIDSKVNPLKLNNANGPGGAGSNQQTGANQQGISNQANANQPTAESAVSSDAAVVVAPAHARPPAIAANGADSGSGMPTSSELDQNPATPLLPAGSPETGAPATGPADNAALQQGQNGQAGPGTGNAQQGSTAMSSVQNLISSSANGIQPSQGVFGQNRQSGQFGGGALAGIASKAAGHTIKRVNEQTDYSLWEFYYDPSKDTSMGAGGGVNPIATTGSTAVKTGATNANPISPTAVGNSGFGNNNPINNDPNATLDNNGDNVNGQPVQTVPITPAEPTQQ